MDRTYRAALLAVVLSFLAVAGLGVFLGFPTSGSVTGGLVAGVLTGMLLLGAGRRAETFHPTVPTAHLAEHRPSDDADLLDDADLSDDPDPGAHRG